MPAAIDARIGQPAPGEVVTGELGGLVATIHNGFPGVALGISVFAADATIEVHRIDLDTGERIVPRTCGPVLVDQSDGTAYDIEAEPGHSYLYRVVIGGVERPIYDVRVAIPGWDVALPARHTGWLKSMDAPHLSAPVRMGPPPDQNIPLHTSGHTGWGTRYGGQGWGGRGPTAGSYIVHGLPEDDHEAILDLLASGPLLWQPRPEIRTRGRWLQVTGITDKHISSRTPAREWSVAWEEIPRPVDDLGGPYSIPGWPWDRVVAGLDWDAYGRVWGSDWQMAALLTAQPWTPYAGPAR